MPVPASESPAAVLSHETGDAHAPLSAAAASAARWPVMFAAALGAVIILGVGFGPGLAHNAAHDTRHTLAYPCH